MPLILRRFYTACILSYFFLPSGFYTKIFIRMIVMMDVHNRLVRFSPHALNARYSVYLSIYIHVYSFVLFSPHAF